MEECTENIDEAKLTGIALFEHGNECVCSYTVCIVLGAIALTIWIGIGAYFTYKYINRNKENVSKYDHVYQTKNYLSYKMGRVKQINVQSWTYYFYIDMINIKNFEPNLLQIDKKSYKNIGIYNIRYVTIKKLMIVKIFTVWILCIWLLIRQVDIWKNKMKINTWFLTLQMKTKIC